MVFLEFTSEENVNRKRKYFIPWNQIDLESKTPIKKFKLGDNRDMVCSEGNIVIFNTTWPTGSFGSAHFNTESFESLTLNDPFDKQVNWPRAVSNDGKLAVGLVQRRSTERMNLRSHGPIDEDDTFCFVQSTMLKIFNSKKENKVTCKNIFGGQYMDVQHIKISTNNNLVAVIYVSYRQRVECKIFKFTDKGGCKQFRKFNWWFINEDDELGLLESSFNAREDLYMITAHTSGCGDAINTILVYDINKKEIMGIPSDPDFCFFKAYLICTQDQNLVYVYDEENILSCYDLAHEDYNRVPIMEWNIKADLDITVFNGSIVVHHFTKTRVYVSTRDTLHVLCPFKKTILQSFEFPNQEDVAELKIVLNWSGEEIFLRKLEYSYEVFTFFFCENKEEHLKLTTLTRRAVHSNFSIASLQKMNLPSSIKRLLGVA
eukprot:TCONS_00022885-protein